MLSALEDFIVRLSRLKLCQKEIRRPTSWCQCHLTPREQKQRAAEADIVGFDSLFYFVKKSLKVKFQQTVKFFFLEGFAEIVKILSNEKHFKFGKICYSSS